MLDIISMVVLLIIFALIGIFGILIIIGGNMYKSEEEQKFEDEEQIKYIKNYMNRKKNK